MFESTTNVLFLDTFRVPYSIRESSADWHTLSLDGRPVLAWPDSRHRTRTTAATVAGDRRIPVVASVVPERESRFGTATSTVGRIAPVVDAGGETIAWIRRDGSGAIVLPFDPSEAMLNLQSEAYRVVLSRSPMRIAKQGALRVYYAARPAIPRRGQIWMRQRVARVQGRVAFPRWPLETALHDLYELLFDLLADATDGPIPFIAPWPNGSEWAVVLTHDVETQVGHDQVHLMRRQEERHGLHSSWNFVPRRYETDALLLDELRSRGFEIGVHGLYHDGRDLESETMLRRRLPEIRAWAEQWGAVGFRSPATHRDWRLMPLLGFDYDSSSPDTDPYEPQAGGCCSLFPFFNGDLVELPITLPQDHTLFVILGLDEQMWIEKAEAIRDRGGMALLITHPDYMLGEDRLAAYDRFLSFVRDAESAWHALPRDIAQWWRDRAASHLERTSEGWQVVGPARPHARVALSRH
jgi:hypothetical protein